MLLVKKGPNYCWHLDGYDKLSPFYIYSRLYWRVSLQELEYYFEIFQTDNVAIVIVLWEFRMIAYFFTTCIIIQTIPILSAYFLCHLYNISHSEFDI